MLACRISLLFLCKSDHPYGENSLQVTGYRLQVTGLQVYRFTGLQVYRFTGLQVYRFTGLQVYRLQVTGYRL